MSCTCDDKGRQRWLDNHGALRYLDAMHLIGSHRFCFVALFALVLSLETIRAEDPLPDVSRLRSSPVLQQLQKNTPPERVETAAEKTVAQMYVPAGFKVDLVLAEPDLHQPVAFAFDDRGRLWIAEAYSYPQKQPAEKGLDKIVIFSDRDGDGRFETRKVFAENLNLVSGLEVGYGGVWVGAAPELLFIPDRDQDDVPDGPPEVLLDGFGFQDTHECLNSFLWGPDGWLYGNQGVFNTAAIGPPGAPDTARVELRAGVWRFHPIRHQFEVFAYGGSNAWGLDYDQRGQLFMTHCRSYWGRGCTTHVIQGGHFWNQANANYAPFIIPNPPAEYPQFRNYLLASARYDHGAGGAGQPGSDAIYGGHSHVGTMIYLGDNWPDTLRGHLFTHNLGGHQMNHQVNQRLGSGFDTVHGGQDQLFCTDPKYVAVDLQYGPDGAVYMIDWYDQQHCHNPNSEIWDRSNGRVYRMQYTATYKPKQVNLRALDDAGLAALHQHKNEWFVRTARRLLIERAQQRSIAPPALATLQQTLQTDSDPVQRLRALWTVHGLKALTEQAASRALQDQDEYVRAWTIQLLSETAATRPQVAAGILAHAQRDPSPVVRLYCASAAQRHPPATAWPIMEALAQHAEDAADRNLPLLLWHGLAQLMPGDTARAFALAAHTKIPQLSDYVAWYAGKLGDNGLSMVLDRFDQESPARQATLLAGLTLAVEGKANIKMPPAWPAVSPTLYASSDVTVRRQAERLGGVFGDRSVFPRLRATLQDEQANGQERQHAFAILSAARDQPSLPLFIALLDNPQFRSAAVTLLGRLEGAEIAPALIAHYPGLPPADKATVLNTLSGRSVLALALLKAVGAHQIERRDLTAFHIRQMSQFSDPAISAELQKNWGKISSGAADKRARIEQLVKVYDQAPLWAYSQTAGRQHFQKICAPCHRVKEEGNRLGPELTGAGRNGIRYYLENVIDPNAVVGNDFQMILVTPKDGEVISGLLESENDSALIVRTPTDRIVVEKAKIVERRVTDQSLMPEGLLEALNEREQIELLKFLMAN